MECVNCGINLLKNKAKMNDYSKSSVEVLDHTPESHYVFKLNVSVKVAA